MITDDMLVLERPNLDGVQRLYRLPNGYGLSAVNAKTFHAYSYAWEFAVVSDMREDGAFDSLTYDTPLTTDVEVFETDAEANEFIAQAKAWAESEAP